MKNKPDSPLVIKYFLLLFIITICLVGRLFWPFVSSLILSLILVNIFRPVYNFFTRYTSGTFASLLTCFLIVLLVFVPLTFFVAAVSQEAIAYFQYMKGFNFSSKIAELTQSPIFTSIQEQLNGFGFEIHADDLSSNLTKYSRMVALFFYNKATGWATNIINFIVDFSLMILVIFYLLLDYDRLAKFIKKLSPLPDDQEEQLVEKFEKIAQAILLGNGICGLIQGVIGGGLFVYLGISSPILWGGVMGVMAFLPIVGVGIVLIPTAVIFLLKGSLGTAIFITIFYLILSLSIEYLVKPKLVGRQVKMHTLLVFLSIIGGLSLFGVLGIIYGPLIITAFLTMSDIYFKTYAQHFHKEKGTASSTPPTVNETK